jgi:hypothetical protein
VCRAKKHVSERLEFLRSELNLGTKHVGEEIALHLQGPGRTGLGEIVAAIALEIHLDSKVFGDVHDEGATAAIETEASGLDG